MSKSSEAIFNLTPKNGVLIPTEDYTKYLLENEGIEQRVNLKQSARISEKERLYNYFFGPVMSTAVIGFTNAGYTGIDKVKARYIIEAEFAKEQVYNPIKDTTMTRTEHVSSMSKGRLLKLVVDTLFFIELELGCAVPDAEQFKMQLKTGKGYNRIT